MLSRKCFSAMSNTCSAAKPNGDLDEAFHLRFMQGPSDAAHVADPRELTNQLHSLSAKGKYYAGCRLRNL